MECSDALNELHGQIQQYIQDLKDMRDAQRDATISTAETYTTIATSGYAYSAAMQNDQLSYQNTQLGKQNTAYSTNTSNVKSDTTKVANKALGRKKTKNQSATGIYKAISSKDAKKHKSYKKALKTAQKNIKARKKISSSTLKTIKKYNMEVYSNCYAYNLQLDELETTRLEELTNYASTSADIFANTAEKYSNKNEQAENNISLYQLQASNATSASSANSYLDKAAKQYDTIVSNDNSAVSDYTSSMKSAQKTIKNKSGKGSSYSNASSSTKKNIKKYIKKAKDAAAAGKYIPQSTITKLSEYASKNYVSNSFVMACMDYNNALAYKEEAEAQLAIDKETAKQEKAAIGTEKFENVEQEYTNKINSNQAATSLLEAQQATKETRGVALTADDYNTLISQSKELQQIYEEEITALDKEVQSNLSSGYWTKSSQEYLDAINAIDNYKVELEDCKTAQEEYNNALAQLPYDTIEKALELLDSIANYNESVAKLRTALGEDLDESDYLTQMEDIQNKIDKYTEEMEQAWEDYNKALADVDQVYGGQTADEWLAAYNDYATAINEAKVDLEDLKDELRDDVYWRTFDRAHDSCERFSNVLEGLMDLIDSDMYFDADGNITEYGIAQVANLVSEYENARKEVENYSNDIENLNNLYAEGYYTTEEFEEKLNELQESMLDSAKSMKSAMSDLVDMYKDMAQAELDSLIELIDKRNEALDKKKSYYDYDKTISDKNKDIQTLQAQIAALEGVETAEAKAKKASLEAELAEAQESLEDEVQSHVIELSQDALDELQDSLQDAFDDYFDNISGDLEQMANLLAAANDLTASSTDAIVATLDKLLEYYGIDPVATGISDYYTGTYATGTKKVTHNQKALTNEKGEEIVVTKEGMITPLKYGDGVVPADLTKKLYDMAQNGNIKKEVDVNVPKVEKHLAPNINVSQSYDSLIDIEGSADAATVEDLKNLHRDLLDDSYQYTRKKLYRTYQDVGGKRHVS